MLDSKRFGLYLSHWDCDSRSNVQGREVEG